MTTHQKLIKAWEVAPKGAKAIVYKEYTQQNVSDIIKNGRKDTSIMSELVDAIKKASNEVAKDIAQHNKKVQAI